MKLSIFHFSDSHWVPRWTDPTTNDPHEPSPERVAFYTDYIRSFEALDLKRYYGDETIVIHTGDFGNFPSKKENELIPPVKEMFADIRDRHLRTFDRKFNDVCHKLAVPGNHDADREANETERFSEFCAALRHWHWKTPFDTPVVRFSIFDLGDKHISISLFNSVSAERDAAIERDRMDAVLPDTDYFRIALLHHNLLPHYGQRANRAAFVNGGDFNTYLGDNAFKLVLSGHQHLGNEMLFAVPTCLKGSDQARPTLESVFLTIAAPAFLRPEYSALLGFNVVEIEIVNDSNFVTITLHKFRFSRERHVGAGRFEKPETIVFRLLASRIDRGNRPLSEQERRIKIARKVVDRLYDSDSEITQLEQLVLPSEKPGHFQMVRRELQVCQQIPNNIAALYSIAVLPPSHWWQGESAFRRLFIENVGRAASRSEAREPTPVFSFSFSKPLVEAINRARANAQALKIMKYLRDRREQLFNLGRWCESRLDLNVNSESSMSVWELEDYPQTNESLTRRILVKSTNNEIAHTVPEWDCCNSRETLEIARIAIWPAEYFEYPDAGRLIELHEDCLVPLFWLNPTKLMSSPDKTGKRGQRKQWGYDLIYARQYRNREGAIAQVLDLPRRYINDKKGESPVLDKSPGREAYANDLWGDNGAPAYFRQYESRLSAEFSVLLRRPDILFAIDAYAMRRADMVSEGSGKPALLDLAMSSLSRMYDDDTWFKTASMVGKA